MKNILFYVGVAVILFLGALYFLNQYIYIEKQGDFGFEVSYKDTTYIIDGVQVTLVDGVLELDSAQGASSKDVYRYFGNEAEGDINGDGVSDIAFLLTKQSGGSGTFYYVVAATRSDAGYVGTNSILLGDRIAPQTTEIRDGHLIVNYADRAEGEPMTVQPSVGVSLYAQVVDGNLIVVTR